MQDSGPQQVRKAISEVEQESTLLLKLAHDLTPTSQAWQHRDLLKAAREYARAVNALTRIRKASPKPSTK